MSTNNIGFYEDLTKNIFELSSNTQIISSAVAVFKGRIRVQLPYRTVAIFEACHHFR